MIVGMDFASAFAEANLGIKPAGLKGGRLHTMATDELLATLLERLSTAEQQAFVRNYHMYLQYYRCTDTDFVIDLDNVISDIGFSLRGNAKAAIVKHLELGVDYTVQESAEGVFLRTQKNDPGTEPAAVSTHARVGRPKETIHMTVHGFKQLCMSARTDRGRETRKYFIAMEEVMMEHLKRKDEEAEIAKVKHLECVARLETAEARSGASTELAHHNALLASNNNVGCVYVARVKMLDGVTFVIKLGETDDLHQRVIDLKCKYGEFVLLAVFRCPMPHRCEQELRALPPFIANQYSGLVNDKSGTEFYVASPAWPWHKIYKTVRATAEKHCSADHAILERDMAKMALDKDMAKMAHERDMARMALDKDIAKMALEESRLTMIRQLAHHSTEHLERLVAVATVAVGSTASNAGDESTSVVDIDGGNVNNAIDDVSQGDEGIDGLSTFSSLPATPRRIKTQGHQIQRYTADGKTLLATYAYPNDAARDPALALDRPHAVKIADAVRSHRTYKGFRWAHLPPAAPPDTVQDVGTTACAQTARHGFVAVLDVTGTRIEHVHASMTEAARERNVVIATISVAMTRNTTSGGNRFAMLQDCTPEMRATFEASCGAPGQSAKGMPPKPTRGNGRAVEKLGADGTVMARYACIADAIVDCRLTRARLFGAIASKNAVVDGTGGVFVWRYA